MSAQHPHVAIDLNELYRNIYTGLDRQAPYYVGHSDKFALLSNQNIGLSQAIDLCLRRDLDGLFINTTGTVFIKDDLIVVTFWDGYSSRQDGPEGAD